MLPLEVPSCWIISPDFSSPRQSFTTRRPSSLTRRRCVRLSPIAQIFPTAASRRSLGRVSVPVWLIILSDQLPIVALVEPLPHQLANGPQAHPESGSLRRGHLSSGPARTSRDVCGISALSEVIPHSKGRLPTCYSPVRRFTQAEVPFLARLACVRHAASVRSEPGSLSVDLLTLSGCIGCVVTPSRSKGRHDGKETRSVASSG